jgi:hypothetical protein
MRYDPALMLLMLLVHSHTQSLWCSSHCALSVDTHCTVRQSCDRKFMEYTCNEYWDMLLTVGASDSWAGTALWECPYCYPGWCYPDDNMFRWLEQCLWKTGSLTLPACVRVGCLQTVQTLATKHAIIAAVGTRTFESSHDITMELGLPQALVLNVHHYDETHPYHFSHSQHQLSEYCPLWMQFCEWPH